MTRTIFPLVSAISLVIGGTSVWADCGSGGYGPNVRVIRQTRVVRASDLYGPSAPCSTEPRTYGLGSNPAQFPSANQFPSTAQFPSAARQSFPQTSGNLVPNGFSSGSPQNRPTQNGQFANQFNGTSSQFNGQPSQFNGQAAQVNGQASQQFNGQPSQFNGQANQFSGQAGQQFNGQLPSSNPGVNSANRFVANKPTNGVAASPVSGSPTTPATFSNLQRSNTSNRSIPTPPTPGIGSQPSVQAPVTQPQAPQNPVAQSPVAQNPVAQAPVTQTPAPQTQTSSPLVGSWQAKPSNEASIVLTLSANNTFNWTVTSEGKPSSFQGTYSLTNDTLTLTRGNDNENLAGTVRQTSANSFSFRLQDGSTNNVSFEFSRNG